MRRLDCPLVDLHHIGCSGRERAHVGTRRGGVSNEEVRTEARAASGASCALAPCPPARRTTARASRASVTDASQAALPGVTVDAASTTPPASSVFKVTDAQGPLPVRLRRARHLHGDGRARRVQEGRAQEHPRPAARRRHREPHAGDRHAHRDGHRRRPRRRRSSSTAATPQITLERQLIDQVPLSGRNPYNLAMLDPTLNPGVGTTANENRPYHHAFANDYDAGGGTRRANDVLLDGVPLGAELQDGLHAVDGRGRGDHGLEDQRRRRERQQPGRHHQPEHEVGHEHASRARPTTSAATRA